MNLGPYGQKGALMSAIANTVAANRIAMGFAGALAGAAGWFFIEAAEMAVSHPRLFLVSVTFVMGFFAVLLGLKGPLNWPRAAAGAGGVAGGAALLLLWASLRFDAVEPFFESVLPVLALFLLLFIGTPFVSAALQERGGARNYALLFDTSWALLVRYLAGWLFVAVVWSIVFLSDALLSLVGITVIEDVIELEPVPFVLTGLFLGVALAVMHELRDYISPFLVLRLFRILLPVLTLVVGIFLVALPIRGFDALFGTFSVAATLMAVAIAAITLITSTLDRTDRDAATAPLMIRTARVMSVMLIPLTLAAAWAVWLRVAQYGWTPERVAASLSACVLVIYGLAYGLSVLRAGWPQRLRQSNLAMALFVLALSALWMTPVFHAEALSTRSQIARFEAGEATPDDLPIWRMANDWGRAGTKGMDRLRALAEAGTHPEAEALARRLEQLDAAGSRYAFENSDSATPEQEAMLEEILQHLVLRPESLEIRGADLAALPVPVVENLWHGCQQTTEDVPGCVMVLADLKPLADGEEGLLIYRSRTGDTLELIGLHRGENGLSVHRTVYADIAGQPLRTNNDALLSALADGDIAIVPSGIDMISIGGIGIVP